MPIIRDAATLQLTAVLSALDALLTLHALKHARDNVLADEDYVEYNIFAYPHLVDGEHGLYFTGHEPGRHAFIYSDDSKGGTIVIYLADKIHGQISGVLSATMQPNSKAQCQSLQPGDFVGAAHLIYDYLRTG